MAGLLWHTCADMECGSGTLLVVADVAVAAVAAAAAGHRT